MTLPGPIYVMRLADAEVHISYVGADGCGYQGLHPGGMFMWMAADVEKITIAVDDLPEPTEFRDGPVLVRGPVVVTGVAAVHYDGELHFVMPGTDLTLPERSS